MLFAKLAAVAGTAFVLIAASASQAAAPAVSTGTIHDGRGDAENDAIDIVAASANYTPKKGLVITLRLAKPFDRDLVFGVSGVTLGAYLADSEDDDDYKAAYMEIYEDEKPSFQYGDPYGSTRRVKGSIRGRYVTIVVPRPDLTRLRYATFFGEGPLHTHDYAPALKDDDTVYVPFR